MAALPGRQSFGQASVAGVRAVGVRPLYAAVGHPSRGRLVRLCTWPMDGPPIAHARSVGGCTAGVDGSATSVTVAYAPTMAAPTTDREAWVRFAGWASTSRVRLGLWPLPDIVSGAPVVKRHLQKLDLPSVPQRRIKSAGSFLTGHLAAMNPEVQPAA